MRVPDSRHADDQRQYGLGRHDGTDTRPDLQLLNNHTGEDTSTWAEQFRSYYQNTHSTDNGGNWYQVYCEPDATDAERAATGWDQTRLSR